MNKLIVLAILGLAGCPSTVAPGRGTSPNAFGKVRCPDPSTDCTVNNGRRVTGVIVDDAPARVTSVQLRSGQVINLK
jgi:hypothetical protein